MATYEFKLPDIGEGVVEGEIVKWLVKDGDIVKEDQPLVEVMTDKATVTIPSPKAGTVLKTFGKEGEIAKVHGTLVTLDLGGNAAAPAAVTKTSHAPEVSVAVPAVAAPVAVRASGNGKVLATPVTRRMARELGLNLADISGSGPQGRVTKADVEAAMGSGAVASAKLPTETSVQVPMAALFESRQDTRVPIRGLRRKIAEKMVKSKFTAPHYTFVEEVDVTSLVELRNRMNSALASSGEKTKLSFLPFIVKATVAALKKYPQVNANMDEATQELILKGDFNVGIAAATEEGLTVPVLRHADRYSLKNLADEIGRLGTAAREKRLKMEELTGGGFTITSLGQTGGLFATPIINHPEVAILGIHKMRKRPVVTDDDQIVIRHMMYVSLSCDHRVVDGALGADFTYEIMKYLEKPELLFLES